jgi:peptide/nickel transport system permease protein
MNSDILYFKDVMRRLCKEKLSLFCLIVVAAYFVTALGVEGYSIYCRKVNIQPVYDIGKMEDRFQPPSAGHLMGTDYLGRDVFMRALAGTATAIKVGALASLISAIIGVLLGTIAGYFGGWIDELVVWLYSTFDSMPTLLFILAFALLVSKGFLYPPLAASFAALSSALNTDPGMMAVYLGIGITGWVSLCRVVRGETLKLRECGYVQAAQVAGQNSIRIITHHIIPNLFHLVIIYFTMRFAFAIMTEVIVSYLGLGVQRVPSWGVMIADGQERLWRGIWWEVAAATGFMFLLVLCLNMLGDALRDTLDPKLKD